MADLSSVTDNYLPTASETFTDNLSSSIAAEATTVPVNSAVEYADGDTVVLTVAPGTANEATFVGKKDVGSNQFIECVWTEGNTSVGHDAGTTIIDYDSATHYNLLSEALQLIMNQDGTLKDDPIRTALGLSDASNDGWEVFPYTFAVSSGYNKGQNEYDLTVANQDVTSILSPGMRLRLERSTTAPTQCADFESGSSHYAGKASPAGITFTDDFTCEAWIKLESYTGGDQYIINRRNANTAGWSLTLNSNGRLTMTSLRIASNNRTIQTFQSISVGKWTHVAATMDNSANTHTMYINGVSVPFEVSTTGTITALVQPSVDLRIGSISSSSASHFDGKICEARVWAAVRTATEIRDNMNQALTGSETNLVAYFPLNGNFEDLTSNENDLTASGGVVATDTDNPFSDTQYAIVTKVAYSAPNSTVTVFTGNAHLVPNMTLNSPYYSVQKVPYGFPASEAKWYLECFVPYPQGGEALSTNYTGTDLSLNVPIGAWLLDYIVEIGLDQNSTSLRDLYVTLSADGSGETNMKLNSSMTHDQATAALSYHSETLVAKDLVEVTSQTTFELLYKLSSTNSVSNVFINNSGQQAPTVITAKCAYL